MELKVIVVFLIIVLGMYNFLTYTPVDSERFGAGAPSPKSVILFLITMILFIYGLYLNEYPIYL